VKKEYGLLQFDDKISVTDPMYDPKNIGRVNHVKIKPGAYRMILFSENDHERITRAQIVHAEAKISDKELYTKKSWSRIGRISIDSGIVGFFQDNFDLSDKQKWNAFCASFGIGKFCPYTNLFDREPFILNKHSEYGTAFFLLTYPSWARDVLAISKNNEIIALEIRIK